MKPGPGRFEFYLEKLEQLLQQASKEKNAALWLYSNDARTTIFMLEGLAKLYAGLHNSKRFEKLKEDFKLLEDCLGSIDYYDAFAKEFSANSNIPAEITAYMHAQSREKLQRLNDLLQERKWIGEKAGRLIKIRKKLSGADWMKDTREIMSIAGFYEKSIAGINSFVADIRYRFTDVEAQMHELRRRLRWLSIYPRALQGAIQLTDNKTGDATLSKYLTEEIINSPFNKMPDAGSNRCFLMLEKNYFLSLSWMIAALGKLKDSGLRVIAVAEAYQHLKAAGKPEAMAMAYKTLGDQQQKIAAILSESSNVCETYFKEKNLDKLLAGVTSVSKETAAV